MHRRLTQVVLAVLLVAVVACSRQPLKVTTIQVGKSLNSDKSVGAISTQFKPTDTIYVAALNNDAGAGTLTARWTYAGRPVSEETKSVSYQGEAATEFHIQNSGGFPEGDYKVEILLDGQSVGTRDFRVAK
jgi:curli biogenesis system outer membrane secretion channel CsgG